ncbi:hypothetical protein [Natronospira bacteriovora]|uniref:Lipoprotein n=1 Tax=Natronospira bacteriovora TaxID=3069753 RepID=A0ABU0W6L6_9GAMM|nr:hypothetical protein [Natronospira sp. AB-CW4]MDQ2069602.1 hypothetical protein [Natronospira sp. AB-CW4]
MKKPFLCTPVLASLLLLAACFSDDDASHFTEVASDEASITFGSDGGDRVYHLAARPDGGFVVAGTSEPRQHHYNFGAPGLQFLRAYDDRMQPLWTRFPFSQVDEDIHRSMAGLEVLANGQVITLYHDVDVRTDYLEQGNSRGRVLHFDANGDLLREWDVASENADFQPIGMAVAHDDRLYIAGADGVNSLERGSEFYGQNSRHYHGTVPILTAYQLDGERLWYRRFIDEDSEEPFMTWDTAALTVLPSGDVAVNVRQVLVEDWDGEELALSEFDRLSIVGSDNELREQMIFESGELFRSITSDAAGNILIGVQTQRYAKTYELRKFTSGGDVLRENAFDDGGFMEWIMKNDPLGEGYAIAAQGGSSSEWRGVIKELDRDLLLFRETELPLDIDSMDVNADGVAFVVGIYWGRERGWIRVIRHELGQRDH